VLESSSFQSPFLKYRLWYKKNLFLGYARGSDFASCSISVVTNISGAVVRIDFDFVEAFFFVHVWFSYTSKFTIVEFLTCEVNIVINSPLLSSEWFGLKWLH